jgi:hypothetical protein
VIIRYLVFFAIAFAPIAPAQDQIRNNSADRALVAPTSVPPAGANADGVLDKILVMVGPADEKPQTRKEAFDTYLLSTVGPVPILGEAAGAGIGQWTNSPKEWGQGWGAYGKRFGSNMAYNAVRQTITYGAGLTFHEDSRYFASHAQGFWPRTKHALVTTFTARHPDGRQSFAVSSVAGVIGAASISSIWGPPSWKGPGNIAENAGFSFASTAASNVVREFLPDIFHRPRK